MNIDKQSLRKRFKESFSGPGYLGEFPKGGEIKKIDYGEYNLIKARKINIDRPLAERAERAAI